MGKYVEHEVEKIEKNVGEEKVSVKVISNENGHRRMRIKIGNIETEYNKDECFALYESVGTLLPHMIEDDEDDE